MAGGTASSQSYFRAMTAGTPQILESCPAVTSTAGNPEGMLARNGPVTGPAGVGALWSVQEPEPAVHVLSAGLSPGGSRPCSQPRGDEAQGVWGQHRGLSSEI